MNKLSIRNRMLVGLTLFSMFFGAGNLIFPPSLGAMAGTKTPLAMLGFSITAIGFPILGVIAVSRAGSLDELAGRVHPTFAKVFTLLIYLSIGPCLAIPRTASTSFEMAVAPFLSGDAPRGLIQLIYSVLFFAVALYFSLTPEKLTQLLGRFTSPCLLLLIGVVFIGCVLAPPAGYGEPIGVYAQSPVLQGFLGGYQTMDAIAALNFGLVIAMNINNRGVTERSAVVKEITYAGGIASLLFLAVYGAIAHVGAVAGGAYGELADGTAALTAITHDLFGNVGIVLLGLIFLLACLNTCIGLIACCSEYFSQILPRFSQRQWAFFFAFISMVISNVGLSTILSLSVPVLGMLYPPALVLILLSFWEGARERKLVYPLAIAFTGITSVIVVLATGGFMTIPGLTPFLMDSLPVVVRELLWVGPALLGILLGWFLSPAPARKSV